MKIVIVTGGLIEDAFAKEFIKKEKFDQMIAADSGMEFFYRNKMVPDIIVGDFDSAKSEIVSYFKENEKIKILYFRPEKDETDTELAIKTALEAKPEEIVILGATGTRIDHMIGNIYLLQKCLRNHVSCYMVDGHNRISLMKSNTTILKREQFGKFISLLPLGDKVTGVTLSGFKYPLNNATLSNDNSLGISNELLEETGEIALQEGILLMIESKDE